ncbi:MAG: PqqD family protein [Thermoanaerobaculia bacterium]
MAQINLNSVLKRNSEVRYTKVQEGGLAVKHDTAEILTFNPMAIEIFEKLDGKKRVKDLLEEILKEYEVEKEEAERDLLEFLRDLYDKKMVDLL